MESKFMKKKSEQKCNTSMSFSPYVMTFIQEMASKQGCSVSSLYEKAAIEFYKIEKK